jgi:hypothetical protein
MTRLVDETFEGTGYAESGWSESVGTGCTLDEDASSSDVGSPSGWGDQCLKAVSASTGWYAYAQRSLDNPEPDTWWRFELVIASESLADSNTKELVRVFSSVWGGCFFLGLAQVSGSLVFWAAIFHDGSAHTYTSSAITTGTRYRIEVKWDSTNDEWEWRLDGVTQDSGSLTGSHQTDCEILRLGILSAEAIDLTVYHDLLAVDDADWVGAEETSVTVTPDPAAAVGAAVGPTVSQPVTATPAPVDAVSATAGPTVSAPLTIAPDPAVVEASSYSLYGVGDLTFEVCLIAQDPEAPPGPDDDVTGWVRSFEFSNGMSAAYQILGKSQARLTLVNTDGRFSPEGASALENFTLGRVVRIRVVFAGSLIELFRGTITKIDPSAGRKGERRCLVTAEGWLSRMRQQPFELPLQTNRRADQIAGAIIDAVGVYPPGYGSGGGHTYFETGVETFPYFADNLDDNARVYDALRVLAASEATGRFYQARNGRLRFWDRRYLMKQHAVQATFDNSMAEMDYVYGESIRNQVVVKYHPRQYEDDGPYVLSTHDEGIKFRSAQEEKEIYLRYSDESDLTVSTTDPIRPVRRVDYWGNDEEDGSGDLDFSNALVVSAEHLGTYSKWTVRNSGLSFWLAAGATQRGNDRITDRGRQEVRRSDAASIASYGLYPHTIDTQAQPSHDVARALAYWTVGKFGQPRGEVGRLTIRPLRDATLRAQAVERQIGDRVRLKESQTGVDADYFIVGERWRVSEGAKDVEVSWVVEPAEVHKCLLMGVTGFCEMGSNSRMGY